MIIIDIKVDLDINVLILVWEMNMKMNLQENANYVPINMIIVSNVIKMHHYAYHV